MPYGYLRMHLFDEQSMLPIPQAMVRIYQIYNQEITYEAFFISDENGQVDTITLPTVERSLSLTPHPSSCPYSVYCIDIRSDQYASININDMQIFDNELSYLQVSLLEATNQSIPTNKAILPHTLWKNKHTKNGDLLYVNNKQQIPHYVSLQKDNTIQNIAYIEYIKNIACSLLYPTWQKEALKAMIWNLITHVLTHYSTNYQPSPYIYQSHRNIFVSISEIVDDVFNEYLVHPTSALTSNNNIFLLYLQPTMRWQIQNEATKDIDAYTLLKKYVDAVQLATNNNCENIKHSYPGTTFNLNMYGSDVEILQKNITILSYYYPSLECEHFILGVYDEALKKAIQQFQYLFFLNQNGITNKSTWYKIMYIAFTLQNNSVKKEKKWIDYSILDIQRALNHVASMYSMIPLIIEDGLYNEQTENALHIFISQVLQQYQQAIQEKHIHTLFTMNDAIKKGAILPICFPSYLENTSHKKHLDNIRMMLHYIQKRYSKTMHTPASIASFQELLGIPITSELDVNTWNLLHVFYLQLTYKRR